MFGVADSWEPATAISNKDSQYLSSVWSPCGQFVAVMGEEVVEIWDALTLKPLSTPQSKSITRFRSGLAYSPDGYSLAGCSDTGIVIWDTQTGGEVTRVNCRVPQGGLELVWSNDGRTIATTSGWESETVTVHTYSVPSGKTMFLGTLRSRDKPHVWAHEETFQIIATSQDERGKAFNIFEVGSALTRVQSFPSKFHFSLRAFSPTTYRASLFCNHRGQHVINEFCIFDIHNSEILLQEKDTHTGGAFSPDASFFAAFDLYEHCLPIWKYSSGCYVQWRKFQQLSASLQFSPASLSILGTSINDLYILHLDYFPSALTAKSAKTTQGELIDAPSPDGTYIATGYQGGNTITLTNLNSQNPSPSQLIDTEFKISTMILAGNVLMVKGPDKIVAWMLTRKGVVNGIIGNTRADQNDSLWEISIPAYAARLARVFRQTDVDDRSLGFIVVDEIVIINLCDRNIYACHIRTGEVIKPANIPQPGNSTFYYFHTEQYKDNCNLYHHNMCMQQGFVESEWPISQATLQKSWVQDPDGKHRLWLPPSWRTIEHDMNWFHNSTTLRLRNSSELIIIKF